MPAYVKVSTRLLTLIALLVFAAGAHASTFSIPSDDDLIIGARAIVRGNVLSVHSQLDDQTGRIFTYIRIRIREVLKGQITQREIVLKEEGGQVGSRGSIIYGTPVFEKDERVLLYLDTWRDGSLRVYQLFLGKFSINYDPARGEQTVIRTAPDRNTTIIQSESQGRGVSATSRMEFTAYRAMIKKKLRAVRERSQSFDEQYYKNTPMLAQPPEYIHDGIELAPQYTFLGSPPPRWFEPDVGDPVIFFVNPDGAPNAQVFDDVSAAMSAWSTVPGCALRVINGGSDGSCSPRDKNTIVFNNCDGQFPPSPSCAVILAIGGVGWDASQTKVINGITFIRAATGHISFNPYASCVFGDHCSIREITTHELGHALGLGHSQFSDATMFGVAHFDGRCGSIRQDDINAITFVYPSAGGGPGPLTVVSTSPLGTATLGSPFSRQLIASGGGTPYTWSLVSGSLPVGLSLSSNGIISGTPTALGTSDFTVKVTDPQSVTAQRALSITVIEPASGLDSQFVSQEVPPKLEPGQTFFATIRWINTGEKVWNGGDGFVATSQNPPFNAIWGGNTVPWFGFPVAPGEQIELQFQAFAPSRAGVYDFQWQLYQQGVGSFGQMSASVSITVGDPASLPPAPSVSGLSSLEAIKGTSFTYTFTATGGTAPYSWQVITGALPAGISLNPNTGAITGTAAETGNFSATIQVTDSQTQKGQKPISITVTPPPVIPVQITTPALPAAIRGITFNQQLNATGGKPPYVWTVTAGSLPTGLGLTPAGVISGTPSVTGPFSFSVTATDADSHAAVRALAINVVAPPLTAAPVPPLDGLKGSSFSYQLSASGGTPPYTWSIASGALPAGLSLSSTAGTISGVPTAAGLFNLTVIVRDQASVSTSTSVQIKLIDPETIPAVVKVKYKGGKKLIVTGARINPAAALLLDGIQTSAVPDDGAFLLKPIVLAPGRHEVKIVNPGGISSAAVSFTVE